MPCVRSASVPPADFESALVPIRAGSSPPNTPWSAAPVLLPVPEEESLPNWHLGSYGMFCCDRPYFQQLVTFLPFCKGFDRVFKPLHHRKGWFQRTGRVFWVIDNDPHIYCNSWEAEVAWVTQGDPWGAILATPTFALAVEHIQHIWS
ncbi:hypothetical protein C8R45DRAFT_928975 [Mycena sanguinolenta]|nr:hypothetical protein C8R45DRAFT_928975 [Mycena sanguinolenta]